MFAVRDIEVTYNTPLQLQLSWTEPAIKNGALVKYTVAYDATYFGQRKVSYYGDLTRMCQPSAIVQESPYFAIFIAFCDNVPHCFGFNILEEDSVKIAIIFSPKKTFRAQKLSKNAQYVLQYGTEIVETNPIVGFVT